MKRFLRNNVHNLIYFGLVLIVGLIVVFHSHIPDFPGTLDFSLPTSNPSARVECKWQEPVLVRIGGELFEFPAEQAILVTLKKPKVVGALNSICPSGKPPFEVTDVNIFNHSALWNGIDIKVIAQIFVWPQPDGAKPSEDQASSSTLLHVEIIKLNPEIGVEDLPVTDGFHVFEDRVATFFIAKNNKSFGLKGSPLIFKCSPYILDFTDIQAGYSCLTTHRLSPDIGLTYRFGAEKVPDERWLELDAAIRSVLESIRVEKTAQPEN